MSRQKLRVHETPMEKIASDLRGEVGEVIASWILWRWLKLQMQEMMTDDVATDMADPDQVVVSMLASRLYDDLVARLSELAESKIGRVNFHFAAEKLGQFRPEVTAFRKFIRNNRFKERRDRQISHKELAAAWGGDEHVWIRHPTVIRAVAMAVRLMKRIDRDVLGPAAPYLWREMRARRYRLMSPARAAYVLVPYLRLSEADRVAVVREEMQEGHEVWEPMSTMVDGQKRTVLVNKTWGLVRIDEALLVLHEYPLQKLTSINTKAAPAGDDMQREADV